MPNLRIFVRGDGMADDLRGKEIIQLADEAAIRLGALPGGMKSGRTSVSLIFPLPDGRFVFAQTSLGLLQGAVRGFTIVYGDQIEAGSESPLLKAVREFIEDPDIQEGLDECEGSTSLDVPVHLMELEDAYRTITGKPLRGPKQGGAA